ncbi:MAG: hypothetical protein PHU12_02340 [Candidatus Aenigmarchaeota archaeon]|nr:hypothetical protein [Candidatus Aenigmarchaeota archaeon]
MSKRDLRDPCPACRAEYGPTVGGPSCTCKEKEDYNTEMRRLTR